MKVLKDFFRIFYPELCANCDIDAIVQFQRNAGEKPDMKYLNMLLWQVCDVDTKLILMQKGFDSPDKDYWMMCKEIKTRNDFYNPGQLILAKSGSADVEMGISSF